MPIRDEDQELLQDPSLGPNPSSGLAALLALEVAELLDQLGELLGHGLGPPARATTTFSLSGSIRGHDPAVKRSRRRGERLTFGRALRSRHVGAPVSRPPVIQSDPPA